MEALLVRKFYSSWTIYTKEIDTKMIRHFFLDKSNSIIQGSEQNLGLNPILHVGYGQGLMRSIIHFDIEQIRCLIDDKTFANTDKLSFTLKMTNCFSVDSFPYEKNLIRGLEKNARRAASFDLILFKLPSDFDEGRGFDFISDFWIHDNRSFSEKGSNWYFAKDGVTWITEDDILGQVDFSDENLNWAEVKAKLLNSEGGIYPLATLCDEYEKYSNGEDSIIVGEQHFDFGNENLSIDITKYVMDCLNGEDNNGLCLAFSPKFEVNYNEYILAKSILESGKTLDDIAISEEETSAITTTTNDCSGSTEEITSSTIIEKTDTITIDNPADIIEETETDIQQYVGFFNDHTNTFFHPYVEANYNEYIMDDRESYTLGKENRLYLYVSDDGIPCNLDNIPSFSIDGTEVDVKQATKGVYYAQISPSDIEVEEGSIYYDKWSEIALNGAKNEDIELEFSTHPSSHKIKIGSNSVMKNMVVPSLYGINDDENVNRGEEREVVVDFRKKYTTDKKELISSADYRLYIKDGNRELDVIPYQPIEKAFLNNFFVIYTEDLIPNEYYIDIRTTIGRDIKYFKDVLHFKIVNNITERYQ